MQVTEAESLESTAQEAPETQTPSEPVPQKNNGWVTFLACFGIILREGLEAILVVGAIIAYLVKSKNQKQLKYVYGGSVLAIAASFVCAWLLSLLKLANTANQEIIEGVTALTAVLVILVTLAGSIPAIRMLLRLRPAEVLHGGIESGGEHAEQWGTSCSPEKQAIYADITLLFAMLYDWGTFSRYTYRLKKEYNLKRKFRK